MVWPKSDLSLGWNVRYKIYEGGKLLEHGAGEVGAWAARAHEVVFDPFYVAGAMEKIVREEQEEDHKSVA